MIYEYRAYYAMPGRMSDIQKRFNDVTMKLFAKPTPFSPLRSGAGGSP